MQNHITSKDQARFRHRELDATELAALDDHLAECRECRERLSAAEIVQSQQFVDAVIGDAEHPDYDLLEQFIDGTLAHAQQKEVASHAAACNRCASEIDDLRAFADRFKEDAHGPSTTWQRWSIAAAVVIAMSTLLAVFVVRHGRNARLAVNSISLPPFLRIRDENGVISVDSRGRVRGAPPGWEAVVKQVLITSRFGDKIVNVPTFVAEPDALRGGGEEARLRVVAPVRTVIAEDVPLFQWSGGTPNASFIVEVFDSAFRPIARSAPTRGTEWRPEHPLPRGLELQWQVIETFRAHQRVAPQPPEMPARFFIVGEAAAEEIAAARATKSHLLMATIYARSGMQDAADAEIDALVRLNPHSRLIARLRDNLHAYR